MGSDRKSKEKKNRKRSSSSDSEEEGRRKRQKSEDEERKSRKSDKKEKVRDKDKKSSHKHSKHHSDKEKKSKDKHKSKHRKGDLRLKHNFQELSNDDYFLKNNEFATWLKEEKSMFFSDLSAESAHEMFADFVEAWNGQTLQSKYYEGIATGPRSAHKWKIKE